PMLPAVGCVTASANAVATAASTAVPPSLIASAPMRDAISFCDTTIPFCARTGTELAPVATVRTAQPAATTTKARTVRMARDYTRFNFQAPRRNRMALTADMRENAMATAQNTPDGPRPAV